MMRVPALGAGLQDPGMNYPAVLSAYLVAHDSASLDAWQHRCLIALFYKMSHVNPSLSLSL